MATDTTSSLDISKKQVEEDTESVGKKNSLRSANPVVDRALQSKNSIIARVCEVLPEELRQPLIELYRRNPEGLGRQCAEIILDLYSNDLMKKNTATRQMLDEQLKKLAQRIIQQQEAESRFSVLNNRFSELEARLASVRGKYGVSESDIETVRQEILILKQKVAESLSDVDKVRQVYNKELAQIRDSVYQSAEEKLSAFLASQRDSVERLKNDLTGMLSRATIGVLSESCAKKRDEEQKSMWWKSGFFYAALILLALLGGIMVWRYSLDAAMDTNGVTANWVKFLRTGACFCVPFYVPLIWFACHMNRLAAQSRRLMEEYAHKTVVTQTYSGLAEQIDVLSKQGVDSAKDLSGALLARTISVICTNPNSSLDRVKTITPLSEMVDGASRLIAATKKS